VKKAWFWILSIVVIVVVLVVWSAMQPDAIVEVIQPHTQTVRAYVEERAVTELPHDYLVAMPIGGWLEPIALREGDSVSAGDVVASLDKDDLADRVRQAEQRVEELQTNIAETRDHRLENNMLVETRATVKSFDETVMAAEKKLEASLAVTEFAKSEVERIRKIVQASAAAERELRAAETASRKAYAEYQSDRLELAALKTLAAVSYIGPKFITDYIDRKSFKLEAFEKQLVQARAELEIEKRNLARAQIKSPCDGVILKRHQTRRQYLSAGTPLLTIGRLEEMEIIAEVLTERATRIRPGNPVEIFGEAIAEGPLTGKILRIYPAGFKKISSLGVEQQRVNVAIKLDQRPAELGVAFRVHVRIYYDEVADAITLPRTALFRGDRGQWQVMAVRDGITALQPVEIGLMNDDLAQITQGVITSDVVVARPSQEIVPDMRVQTLSRQGE